MTNYYRSGGYGLRPNRPYGLCPEGEGEFSNCKHPLAGILNRFLDWWCPKMYAASNKSVVDIEKSDGKCLNVIEHLLGKTAGFTHRTAYPLA